MPAPVLVIGAGFIGGAVAAALAASGVSVRCTTRSGQPRGTLPDGIPLAALDWSASTPESLATSIGDARSVVACTAPSDRSVDRARHYLGGARNLVAACQAAGVDRIIYTSSTSALPDGDREMDENTSEWPSSDRGRIQREAEDVVRDGATSAGIPWIILRLAGLYGPGRELGRVYRRREGPLPGDGMAPTNLVHRDDVVQAVMSALRLPRGESGLVNVCDDDHTPRREMYAAMAAERGEEPPRWEVAAAAGAPPRGKRVANQRMKDLLGVRLLHPSHSGPPTSGA